MFLDNVDTFLAVHRDAIFDVKSNSYGTQMFCHISHTENCVDCAENLKKKIAVQLSFVNK